MTQPDAAPTPAPPTSSVAELADREEKRIRTELGRSETKAGVVLTAAGILFSVVTVGIGAAIAVRIPIAVTMTGAASAVTDAAAVVLALLTVKPSLGREPDGWLRYADKSGPAVLELLAAADPHTDQARQVGVLSGLARRKYRVVAAACWLMIAGVILLGAAGVLALVLLVLA
jgi:pycsar effector protein